MEQVLLSKDVIAVISAFQPGLYDIVQSLYRETKSLRENQRNDAHVDAKWRLIFLSWREKHPDQPSLIKLMSCLAYMHPIVAFQAVVCGDIELLKTVASFCNLNLLPFNLWSLATDKSTNCKLETMVCLMDLGYKNNTQEAFHNVIRSNRVDLAQYLIQHCASERWSVRDLTTSMELLNLMLSCPHIYITKQAVDKIASMGHLAILTRLWECGKANCTTLAMDLAARNGHLQVVRFLHLTCRQACTVWAMDSAAQNGHLEIVKFLHENRFEGCSSDAMAGAIERGHLEVVKFLFTVRGEDWSMASLERSARNGHLNVVKFLLKAQPARCNPRLFAIITSKFKQDEEFVEMAKQRLITHGVE
ncbi:hypothetical protein LEN26_020272 [Aphanomyces euteiches]|nr:hypothetical protein LEN26_020272 [Aphanomyces euteiches]KAH9127126.1 hypothetical protein AeMF1_002526 [Aphanomyces euteiches]KAH9187747.1 hypothetical protein AeNC1_010274 [Aphanomyces euteiches]